MLIPSVVFEEWRHVPSLSRRVNANSQLFARPELLHPKLIKKGEC